MSFQIFAGTPPGSLVVGVGGGVPVRVRVPKTGEEGKIDSVIDRGTVLVLFITVFLLSRVGVDDLILRVSVDLPSILVP